MKKNDNQMNLLFTEDRKPELRAKDNEQGIATEEQEKFFDRSHH